MNIADRPWTKFLLVDREFNEKISAQFGKVVEPGEMWWRNSRYEVHEVPMPGGWVHLSFKRHDREPVRDWRDVQRIKNELCGEEREAVELYPAESRLVDTTNQYHLWVAPVGYKFPFGFDEGRTVLSPEEVEEWNRQVGGRGKQR